MNTDKIVYPFKKSDGYYRPCAKGCPNCTHCTDVFWDYSHGIYATICKIHKDDKSDICCADYENDGTEPITIEEWNELKSKEV